MSLRIESRPTGRKTSPAPYLWILPAVFLLALFLFYPIAHTTALSFFDWDGFSRQPFAHFVGLNNFLELSQDAFFRIAFKNTSLFVLVMTTAIVMVSLVWKFN